MNRHRGTGRLLPAGGGPFQQRPEVSNRWATVIFVACWWHKCFRLCGAARFYVAIKELEERLFSGSAGLRTEPG